MGYGFKHGVGGATTKTLGILVVEAPPNVKTIVSKDDKAYTKITNEDGVAIFKGLAAGKWTVTIENDWQTSTQDIEVTLNYTVVIAFFAATISVSYPGKATCTCSDGIRTLYADNSGSYVFTVPNTGSWTITISQEGYDDVSQVVEITADGQSEGVEIDFFTATINVSYPPESTCTATCEGATPLTAPDTSGTWACVVHKPGTWTITATDGTNTKSEAVSITTDGQSVSLTLSYRYYLYNYLDGKTAYDGITGGWNRYTTKDGCISLYNDANMDDPTRCNSKIDFLGYKTLCAEVICWENTSGESNTSFAIGTQTDTTIHSWGAIRGGLCGKADTNWTVKTINVSSINEPVYFSFRGYYSYSAIRAMWLE